MSLSLSLSPSALASDCGLFVWLRRQKPLHPSPGCLLVWMSVSVRATVHDEEAARCISTAQVSSKRYPGPFLAVFFLIIPLIRPTWSTPAEDLGWDDKVRRLTHIIHTIPIQYRPLRPPCSLYIEGLLYQLHTVPSTRYQYHAHGPWPVDSEKEGAQSSNWPVSPQPVWGSQPGSRSG